MKTQAELDAAVIAAADRLYDQTCGWTTGELQLAVRARREAMRPHKAALLNALITDGDEFRLDGDDDVDGGYMDWWSRCDSGRAEKVREFLALLLAAPDEPTR